LYGPHITSTKRKRIFKGVVLSHSIRINAESARRRQPSFEASARKRMRAMGRARKRRRGMMDLHYE
jgi:hypothetical protein